MGGACRACRACRAGSTCVHDGQPAGWQAMADCYGLAVLAAHRCIGGQHALPWCHLSGWSSLLPLPLPCPVSIQWRAWKGRSASSWRRPVRCSSSMPSAQPTLAAQLASRLSTRRQRSSSKRVAMWRCRKLGRSSCGLWPFSMQALHYCDASKMQLSDDVNSCDKS